MLEIGDEVGGAAEVEHLEDAALCLVVAVFGAAFALGNPDVLVAIGDAVADIGGER